MPCPGPRSGGCCGRCTTPRSTGATALPLVTTVAVRAAARAEPSPGGIAHTDPHLGNVVVDATAQPWLLDWDDVALASRERDLVFSRVGVPFFGPVTPAERGAFDDGYGAVDVDERWLAAHA